MRKRNKKKSILSIFIILVVSLSFLTGIAYFYIGNITSTLTKQTFSHLEDVSTQGSKDFSNVIDSNIDKMQLLADQLKNNAVTNYQGLLNNANGEFGFERLEVVDFSQNILASVSDNISIMDKNSIINAQKGVETISIINADKQQYVLFAVPIPSKPYVIRGVFAEETMMKKVRSTAFENSSYFHLIDTKGNVLLQSSKINTNSFENLFTYLTQQNCESGMLNDMKRNVNYKMSGVFELSEINKYIGFSPVEKYQDWLILTVVPSTAVTYYSEQIIRLSIIASVSFVIVMFILFVYAYFIKDKNKQSVEKIAYYDELTGLKNLVKFKIDASEILYSNNKDYAIVKFDVERFKILNDMYGYEKGNEIIKLIAGDLQESIVADEICARGAGDHFVALVRYKDETSLNKRLEKMFDVIREDVYKKKILSDYDLKMPCGIFLVKDRSMDITTMLDRADMAQKTTKETHDKKISYFNKAILSTFIEEKEIENHMVQALENREFLVYLQPKVNLQTKTIAGAEALVRWNHPTKGFMSPAQFIPLFEKNGFIEKLDMFVFEEVCRYLNDWQRKGYRMIPIAINMSRYHLRNHEFLADYLTISHKYKVDRKYIELELTESLIFEKIDQLRSILKVIKQVGFTVSMDDFGAGYSSLNLLKELPFDILKMDQEFLRNSNDTERSHTVIRSMIQMAHDLGIKVVAEGVEEIEEVAFLSEISCDLAQGYYFSKPVDVNKFISILNKQF